MGNYEKNTRSSNFEVLRIVAILMIIFSHFCGHGFSDINNTFSINGFILSMFTLGNLGVVLFLMISGYFLVDSYNVKWVKILKIILAYYFYIIIFYVFTLAFNINEFSIEEIIKTIFALFFEKSWFVPVYLLIYLFHPFINKIFKNTTYKSQCFFILLITICWSIIPTFFIGKFGLNNLISFFCCYCYGAFVKRLTELKPKWFNKKNMALISVSCSILLFASVCCISLASNWVPMLYNYRLHFFSRESVLVLALGFSMVSFCSLSKPFYFKPINFVASFSLGIYLIHDNDSIRKWLWHDFLKVQDMYTNNYMIFYMIGICLGIFAVCLLIDMFRVYALEKPLFYCIDKIARKKQKKIIKN